MAGIIDKEVTDNLQNYIDNFNNLTDKGILGQLKRCYCVVDRLERKAAKLSDNERFYKDLYTNLTNKFIELANTRNVCLSDKEKIDLLEEFRKDDDEFDATVERGKQLLRSMGVKI